MREEAHAPNSLKSILKKSCPRVLSLFRSGGIAYLSVPNSYAGWSLNTPGRASQVSQVEG